MQYTKYALQLGIIFIFLFIGEWLSNIISAFIIIPGSIIGMLLLFLSLLLKVIPITFVEETAQFFLKHMGFFFIPLGVSVVESYLLLQEVVIELVMILIISNIMVMGLSAKMTDFMIRKRVKHD